MVKRKFYMVSLGCAKNLVDMENIAGSLYHGGFIPTPELAEADVAIINTCAFLQAARRESLQEIATICRSKNKMSGTSPKIIVTGCLSRYYSENKIKTFFPEVDKAFPPGNYDFIPAYLNKAYPQRHGEKRLLTASPHSVYLKIAEGCNNRCSYCLIPFLRGPLRSRSIDDIVAEARALQALGAREINLVAQDTTAYGLDLYGGRRLAKLLQQLCKIRGVDWIRILYAHPAHIDDDLLETIAAEPSICKYIDMPLQHTNDLILQHMGRRVTRKEITALYEKIRKTIPEVALRTTILVGYPGETEKDFGELLSFLRDYPFERLGAFIFSREKGTTAYLANKLVPLDLAKERYKQVMQQQARISRGFNRELLGKQLFVLIDKAKPGMATGRLQSQAPEVDGKVIVRTSSKALTVGHLVKVRIIGAGAYNFLAENILK